jgi:hypothetical protein
MTASFVAPRIASALCHPEERKRREGSFRTVPAFRGDPRYAQHDNGGALGINGGARTPAGRTG